MDDELDLESFKRLYQPNQREAWNRFVHLYTPLLLAWARKQGLQNAEAADLVQEVFIKLWRLLPTYQHTPGQTFRGWLFTVAKSTFVDFSRHRDTCKLPGADGLSGVVRDFSWNDMDEQEYRVLLIRQALELIRADFRSKTWAAFTRTMVEGHSTAEVAKELGLTLGAVHSARRRVLARLRQELDGLLEDSDTAVASSDSPAHDSLASSQQLPQQKQQSDTNSKDLGLVLTALVRGGADTKKISSDLFKLYEALNEHNLAHGGNGLTLDQFRFLIGAPVGAGVQ